MAFQTNEENGFAFKIVISTSQPIKKARKKSKVGTTTQQIPVESMKY